MKFGLKRKVIAVLASLALLVGTMPVFAQEADVIEVVIEDITATAEALPILAGEAKIKISVKGVDTTANLAQLALGVMGNMDYKSVQYLIENDDDVRSSLQVIPDDDVLYLSAVFSEPVIELKKNSFTDICIVTFRGDTGDANFISLVEDEDESYFAVDFPASSGTIPAVMSGDELMIEAAETGSKAVDAKVTLEMNKVTDFELSQDDFGVDISIIGEDDEHPILFTTSVSKSTGSIVPTLLVETVLAAEQTYTVRVSGAGYVTYEKTGVDFAKALKLTNADFIPGEIIVDGVVDEQDKAKFEEILASGEYTLVADFNRDGKIDDNDAKVFKDIQDAEGTVPLKPSKPTVTGGSKKITVKWNAPGNGGAAITGYVIKYGTSKTKLDKTVEISKASATSETISNLEADTTYYVQIAAVNKNGVGVFSDIVSTKTDPNASEGNGGGGTGGGGGGGGFGGNGGTMPGGNNAEDGTSVNTQNTFSDLGNHKWAEEAIYTLKDKGIISGTTATTFAPGNNIKRGDFILILTRMLGMTNAKESGFKDVPDGSYYAGAIGAAKAAGIANGDGENFRPEDSITRQDLITLAYRAFLAEGYIEESDDLSVLNAFSDKDNIEDYATAPMASMVNAGIIQGSDGKVNPMGYATRAEVAVMCSRLLNLMK